MKFPASLWTSPIVVLKFVLSSHLSMKLFSSPKTSVLFKHRREIRVLNVSDLEQTIYSIWLFQRQHSFHLFCWKKEVVKIRMEKMTVDYIFIFWYLERNIFKYIRAIFENTKISEWTSTNERWDKENKFNKLKIKGNFMLHYEVNVLVHDYFLKK